MRKSGLKVAGEFGEDIGSKIEPVHLRLFNPVRTGCPGIPPPPPPRSLTISRLRRLIVLV